MARRTNKDALEVVNDGYAYNPLRILHDLGFTSEQIKAGVVECFEPFFTNQNILRQQAFNLTGSWCSYLTSSKRDFEFEDKIRAIVSLLNDAYLIDAAVTVDCIRHWMPSILQDSARYWSLLKNQYDLIEIPLEDFLEAAKEIIAKFTEGISKSYLYMLTQVNRIKNRKPNAADGNSVEVLDFGNIIDELSHTDLADMLVFPPRNLKFHDWRNISAHHNIRIKAGELIVEFKPKKIIRHQTFTITREELYNLILDIGDVSKALKISLDLFISDHGDEVSYWLNDPGDAYIRPEAALLEFYTALAHQGYKIESLENPDDDTAHLVLCDMSEGQDLKFRAISASQFLLPLWKYTKRDKLQIEYRTKKGKNIMLFSTTSEICTQVEATGNINLLAKSYQYEVLSPFFTTSYDPFVGIRMKLSSELTQQTFYSQQGHLIDAESFIKQFTLSVFTNYLAAIAEGAIPSNISTVLANDGCLMTSVIEGRRVVLYTRAPIISKDLRTIIIECLESTVKAYEEDNLAADLIVTAKNENGYLDKRIAIREIVLNGSERSNV